MEIIKTDEASEIPANIRITSKTVYSLRAKLGLSQGLFAQLLGVSSNSIYMMERKKGRLNLRKSILTKLLELKNMEKKRGSKEA